jgi:hypothetical protein
LAQPQNYSERAFPAKMLQQLLKVIVGDRGRVRDLLLREGIGELLVGARMRPVPRDQGTKPRRYIILAEARDREHSSTVPHSIDTSLTAGYGPAKGNEQKPIQLGLCLKYVYATRPSFSEVGLATQGILYSWTEVPLPPGHTLQLGNVRHTRKTTPLPHPLPHTIWAARAPRSASSETLGCSRRVTKTNFDGPQASRAFQRQSEREDEPVNKNRIGSKEDHCDYLALAEQFYEARYFFILDRRHCHRQLLRECQYKPIWFTKVGGISVEILKSRISQARVAQVGNRTGFSVTAAIGVRDNPAHLPAQHWVQGAAQPVQEIKP